MDDDNDDDDVDDVAPNGRFLWAEIYVIALSNRQQIFGALIFCSDGCQTMGCLS